MMIEKLKSPSGTELLCKNIVNTEFSMLSEENIRIFKDRLIDMAGCIFGGALVDEDQFLEQHYKEWGGKAEAPLFASAGRLPLPAAVMLNCVKARANDFGSMLFRAFGEAMPSHFGETLIPMGLTLADVFGTSGQQLVAGIIAAEDFSVRVLYTLPVRWPADMLLISSAAAALAGKMYGLDAEQMKTALSFATTNATDPGNAYFDYSQEFKLHNGVSAQTGIMAAEYAKAGWRGLEDPYFGRGGLVAKTFDTGVIPPLYEKSFEGLGQVYYTECGFKLSPGGIPTAAAVACGRKLRNAIIEARGSVNSEDITRIHVYGAKNIYHGYYSEPFSRRDQINALFSYRFSACSALLYGNVSVRHVQTTAIQADNELLRLAENAEMSIYEPVSGGRKMKVSAEFKDGRILEAEEDFMILEKYPSNEDLLAKFWDQFTSFGKLPRRNGEKIIELAERVDEIKDMREFTELLGVK